MIPSNLVKAINTAKNYPYITKVGVFGSYARGEEKQTSDIDILIDYDNSSDDFLDDLENFMEGMEQLIHNEIGYVTLPGLMESSNDLYKQNVFNDVKWIYTA